MQRFKNLTKKSGKVASAILSAAMVTSMVLGTNVVEVKAATTDTQTETDVQGVNSVKDVTEDAKKAYISAVQSLPINTVQANEGTIGTSTDFDKYLNAVATVVAGQYEKVNGIKTLTITPKNLTITKEPSEDGTGLAELTFDVKATDAAGNSFEYSVATHTGAIAEITLDSYNTRIEKAKKVIDKTLADYNYNNKTTEADLKTKVAADLAAEKYGDAYKLYTDVDVTSASFVRTSDATAKKDGSAHGSVEFQANKKDGSKAVPTITTFNKTVESNLTRANKAQEALETYFTSTDLRATGVKTTSGSIFDANKSAQSYLAALNFTDMNGKVVTDGGVVVKPVTPAYVLVEKPSTNVDGNAKIGFQVSVGDATDVQDSDKTAEGLSVALKSDQSIAEQIVKDIKAAAEQIDGAKVATAGGLASKLNKEFDAAYGDYKQLDSASFAAAKADFAASDNVKIAATNLGKNFYPDASAVTVDLKFVAKDGGADREGDGKLTINVRVGNETADDSVDYSTTSNQSEADKAAAAVKEALNSYTVTNATTDEDLLKVAQDAVKDYAVSVELFTSDRTTATADKEGSIVVKVTITSTKNNDLKRTAEVNETLTIAKEYKNAFEIKDGKKYYHDENGNLLKNTFLQGTDSPDGYTYYIQNDGSVMQDRLTYHPNGKDVIYFDAEGHEVFDAFVNVKKDVQGNDVDYIGYFGTLGGAYVNQTTYGNGVGAYSKEALFYINDYGVLENKGWFQNAAGNIGYAAPNGTLTASQWGIDQFGRKVYFQANGFLAKGLMTDGVKTYQLDETDGHLVGEF